MLIEVFVMVFILGIFLLLINRKQKEIKQQKDFQEDVLQNFIN